MAFRLEDIIKMMGNPPTGVLSDADVARYKQQQLEKGIMQSFKNLTDADMARMLSLPSAENVPNYANNEMPLYTGGLLQNPQGQMVDPQQLLNTAYDMSAPREMRANAIERLRALGVI